jgi:hypothetical protein
MKTTVQITHLFGKTGNRTFNSHVWNDFSDR